jgi:hypothetical protein
LNGHAKCVFLSIEEIDRETWQHKGAVARPLTRHDDDYNLRGLDSAAGELAMRYPADGHWKQQR